MTDTAVASAVDVWLGSFERALAAGDSAAASELFDGAVLPRLSLQEARSFRSGITLLRYRTG